MPRYLIVVAALAAVVALADSCRAAAPGDAAMPKPAAVFYVAPDGNDSWSGTSASPNAGRTDGPFATPARAQAAVRQLKAAGPLKGNVHVQFRGGTYFLAEPLVFTPDDSGVAAGPAWVIWEAYPGETPVFSGGRRITGFKPGEGGRWTADVPDVKAGQWKFRQLFVNNERRPRTRLPKEGYFRVVGVPGMDLAKVKYDTPSDRFEFKGGDLRGTWKNLADIEVVVLHFWVDTHLRVARVNDETRLVEFDNRARRKFTDDYTKEGARYFVENVAEALDTPGQWYVDRPAGVLHYLSKPGEDMAKAEVIAGRTPQLMRVEGDPKAGKFVEFLAFKGLAFRHAEFNLAPADAGDLQAASTVPAAILLRGARNVSFDGCRVTHSGTYGMELAEGCTKVGILGCELAFLGGGGIRMSGGGASSPQELRTGQNIITDTHIHDCGQIWASAVGILSQNSAGNLIAHNHIHDLYYTGISVGWVWGYGPSVSRDNRIEFNHIHDIGQGVLSDMGGIYTLGVSPGTVIRGNHIHDILSHGYGGWGIYTDEGSTDILIENNVVYRTKTGGFHQHYGKENIVRNNIFAFAKVGQIQRTRQEPHLSFTFERNIVYWTEGPLLHGNWKDDQFKLDNNVYWNAAGKPVEFAGAALEAWRQRGHDAKSVIADPLFADPAKGDFTLKPGSPALKLGFQPIDVKAAGIGSKM